MKKPLLVFILILTFTFTFTFTALHAQIINVRKTFNNAMIYQTNNTINNEVNKGVNSIFNAPGKIFRKVKDSRNNTSTNATNTTNAINNNSSNIGLNTNTTVMSNPQDNNAAGISKVVSSDFVPGANVIFSDNFSSTNPGEFPANWLTNSSGEVRQIDNSQAKWLQFSSNGIFAPAQLGTLSDHFTIEFDAIFHPTPGKDVHYILYLYSMKDKIADFKETNYPGNAGIYFAFNTAAGEIDAENFENGKAGIIDNHTATDLLKSELGNQVHVAISRDKTKLSLHVNGSKVFSSPNALPSGYTYDNIKFGSFFMGQEDFMLINNLTIASF